MHWIYAFLVMPYSKLQAKFCLKSVSPKTKSVEKAMTWSPLKCTFLYFRLLARKLAKFLMSFFKLRVSFPLNFASPYSVMTHNSSKFFLPEILYALDKKSPLKWNVQSFEWMSQRPPNSLCLIWNGKSVFLKLCFTFQCHEK